MLYAGEHVASLDDYLRAFDITLSVMQTEEALERAAYELAEDAWAENVRYLEVRYSPLLHTREGLRPAQVVEAVLRGLRTAKREFGIRYGVILCAIRSLGPESSLRIAELCVAFKNRGVVGFDLAGSEVNNPAKVHRQAFQLVIDNNINCTAHAGESFGPDSVHQAIHKCGAHRIGHGTRLRRERRPAQLRQRSPHPARGLPVVERADPRGDELGDAPGRLLRRLRPARHDQHRQPADVRHHGVARSSTSATSTTAGRSQTIKEIIIAGFKSAFMPYREKADLVAEISRELVEVRGSARRSHRARRARRDRIRRPRRRRSRSRSSSQRREHETRRGKRVPRRIGDRRRQRTR